MYKNALKSNLATIKAIVEVNTFEGSGENRHSIPIDTKST